MTAGESLRVRANRRIIAILPRRFAFASSNALTTADVFASKNANNNAPMSTLHAA